MYDTSVFSYSARRVHGGGNSASAAAAAADKENARLSPSPNAPSSSKHPSQGGAAREGSASEIYRRVAPFMAVPAPALRRARSEGGEATVAHLQAENAYLLAAVDVLESRLREAEREKDALRGRLRGLQDCQRMGSPEATAPLGDAAGADPAAMAFALAAARMKIAEQAAELRRCRSGASKSWAEQVEEIREAAREVSLPPGGFSEEVPPEDDSSDESVAPRRSISLGAAVARGAPLHLEDDDKEGSVEAAAEGKNDDNNKNNGGDSSTSSEAAPPRRSVSLDFPPSPRRRELSTSASCGSGWPWGPAAVEDPTHLRLVISRQRRIIDQLQERVAALLPAAAGRPTAALAHGDGDDDERSDVRATGEGAVEPPPRQTTFLPRAAPPSWARSDSPETPPPGHPDSLMQTVNWHSPCTPPFGAAEPEPEPLPPPPAGGQEEEEEADSEGPGSGARRCVRWDIDPPTALSTPSRHTTDTTATEGGTPPPRRTVLLPSGRL